MSSTPSANGRQRQTLAVQIDRLDSMLDGLAENLNEAVAAAVKEAAGPAVREALGAVLAEMLATPGGAPTHSPADSVQAEGSLSRLWRQVTCWLRQLLDRVNRGVCAGARLAWRYRAPVLAVLGLFAAAVALFVGQTGVASRLGAAALRLWLAVASFRTAYGT